MTDPTPSRSSFAKLNLHPKTKTLRVMVLGQEGVGKSALVVRFITRRFIGEYDRNLEKVYTHQTTVEAETVSFEILDTAGQPQDEGSTIRESNIKWAEAFILMYSVTDRCSFEDCTRLKFLINYNKRRRRLGSDSKDAGVDVPVVLVGNKTDLVDDRMVTREEGQGKSRGTGCVSFHEISVRESVDQVQSVFRDVFDHWKAHKKLSKLRRSSSESENQGLIRQNPEPKASCCWSSSPSPSGSGSVCTLPEYSSPDLDESIRLLRDEDVDRHGRDGFPHILDLPPFRSRSQTDGILTSRRKVSGSSSPKAPASPCQFSRQRRMSISMRGKNSSC